MLPKGGTVRSFPPWEGSSSGTPWNGRLPAGWAQTMTIVIKEWNYKYDNEIKLGQEGFCYEKYGSCITCLKSNRKNSGKTLK